jgi:Mn2+/Fe2+ NRAMP family transporter
MIIVIVVTVKKPKIEKFCKVIFVVTIFTLVVTFVVAEQLVLPNITGDILERSDSLRFYLYSLF